jgi:hypothetical protein
MINVPGEMMFGDPSAMVDMAERSAGVSDRTVERGTKKLTLHPTQLIHGGIFKKWLQFGVGEDPIVKFVDQFRNRLLPANSII